jgi:hypothetical protein
MKTTLKSLMNKVLAWPCLAVGFVSLCLTAGAQTWPVTGWGLEGDAQGQGGTSLGTTLVETPGGQFTLTGNINGNTEIRADLPVPISLVNIGDTITLSGNFTFPGGSLGNQTLRMALLNTNGMPSGTLINGVWSTTTETNWLGYIVDFGSGGNPIVAGRAGGSIKDWDSTSGDYYYLGGFYNKSTSAIALPSDGTAVAGTYYLTISAQLASSNFVIVRYSMTNAARTYADLYTITNPGAI